MKNDWIKLRFAEMVTLNLIFQLLMTEKRLS